MKMSLLEREIEQYSKKNLLFLKESAVIFFVWNVKILNFLYQKRNEFMTKTPVIYNYLLVLL
ncbi:hypothetical protein BKK52_10745 [Rodentibacter trehalosifermentans]|uniref:Uncharacterized protein n=2 Tax=Rodentibacter TaxID=1960084 RepID=A0A1V3IRZ5_9PAST|nr:hypothetical protein BKK49_07770 [Rodentibacter rarus]OOF44679.1 hypothetical protein BKK50_01770 [Rodentibacter rarus]OOF46729.1 hypothetical protein BKK52_10745 [Rodentibacter trehalosifermentans]